MIRWEIYTNQSLKRRVSSRGFTLVELLIVIVVIAILAAVTIVSYNGIIARAYNSTVLSDLSKFSKSLELYRANNNRLPNSGIEMEAAQMRVGVSETAYELTEGNLVWCVSPDSQSYIVTARVKRAGWIGFKSDGGQVEYSGGWLSGGDMCETLGLDVGFWGYGYEPEGWGVPGWREWTGA